MGTRILTPHPTQRNDANALDEIAFSRYTPGSRIAHVLVGAMNGRATA